MVCGMRMSSWHKTGSLARGVGSCSYDNSPPDSVSSAGERGLSSYVGLAKLRSPARLREALARGCCCWRRVTSSNKK